MTVRNRIFPPWSEIKNLKVQLWPGEEFLAKFLDNNLPIDWNIYLKTEFEWAGSETPDIVIAHKSKGIMIFEVKDININKYSKEIFFDKKSGKKKSFFCRWEYVKKKEKKVPIPQKDPIDQALNYKFVLTENIPEIADDIILNSEKTKLIRCGLYFHNEKFDIIKAKQLMRSYDDREINIFDRALLKRKENIHNIVPLLKENNQIKMGEKWFDKFSNWIYPPLHRIEDGIKLSFNKKQKYYTGPKPGIYQNLFGVAGSGKTLVLAYRAAKLLEQNKKVLILCFNITLKHYIRQQIKKAALKFSWKNLRIDHFHNFTKKYSYRHNIQFPFSGNVNERLNEHINRVIEHREENKNYDKFDAIIIDEGQDFEEKWYNFIKDFLSENNELLFAVDKKQNIYNKNLSWVKGRWGNLLDQGYRIPKEHVKIINNFSKDFLKISDDNIENSLILPPDDNQPTLLPMLPKSVWKNVSNFDDVKNEILVWLTKLINEFSMKISDIVILVDKNNEGIEIKNFIQEKLKVNDIMDIFSSTSTFIGRLKKTRFRINSPFLKMSTIHSFKGWESRNVIIVTPENKKIDSHLYAALTRVRENLIIVNQNKRYEKFGNENFEDLN